MQNIGEKIKFVREEDQVLLKLYHKESSSYFVIWLMARGIDYRFVFVRDEDDLFYDSGEYPKNEYLFWINKEDWNYLKDEIDWEEE